MKVLSLFDGISCGRVAFDRAKIPVEQYVAYEVDKNAIIISQKNYPDIKQCGNVFDGDFKEYIGFDILIGGSPCQNWSIIKRNRETSSIGVGADLFRQYVRALEESQCKYFLYENNNSIHDDIKRYITDTLGVQPIIINSALVSAQCRKRCYWTNIPYVTQPHDKGICIKDIIDDDCNKFIDYSKTHKIYLYKNNDTTYHYDMFQIGYLNKGRQGERIYSIYGKSVNLTANSGGMGGKTGLYLIGDTIRMLSVLEAERLQTLPDNYTMVDGLSNTSRYRGIGNGWTVDVIAHILSGLKRSDKTVPIRKARKELW